MTENFWNSSPQQKAVYRNDKRGLYYCINCRSTFRSRVHRHKHRNKGHAVILWKAKFANSMHR